MLGKRLRLAALLMGGLVWYSGCGGGSVAFKEGRKAEQRKDWDTALVQYQKALQSDPANALYVLHEKQVRTQASLFHLKNGRRLLQEGRIDDAAGEFKKAASIDPSNEMAAQELAKVLAKQAEAKKARESAIQKALKTREEEGEAGIVKLQPFSTERLAHFRINADSRMIFTSLGKLAGLNVAFTSDFRPTPLNIDFTDIKTEDALKIVCLQTKTFYRAVTPNTILIVPDSPNNRRDYDEEILKTIYLSNPLAAADRTAITTALKQVLNLTRIIDNPDSNAIIVRDTPEKVAAAEQLIHELDRGKAEILLNIDIVEADRDRIRDLGLSPATVNPATGTTTLGVQGALVFAPTVPTTSSSSSTTTSVAAAINTLTYKDYAVVLPGAEAQAVLNDSKTHILQSPEVRVTDGQTAKLKIGSRIPYATGSFLPSLGASTTTTGVGLLASTQFQFQDVGVNLELTPHLLQSGEIAVHAKIEISSLGASLTVGGVSEPTFGQRVIEDDFRLVEGEVNLLGGLIQSTINAIVTGVPGLGDVPLVKLLFSNQHREVNDQEVLVMLTPSIIRLPEPALATGAGMPVRGGGEGGPAGPPEPFRPGEIRPEPPAQPQ